MTEYEKLRARQEAREAYRRLPHSERPRIDHDAVARFMVQELCAEHIRRAEEAGQTVEEYMARRAELAERFWRNKSFNGGING